MAGEPSWCIKSPAISLNAAQPTVLREARMQPTTPSAWVLRFPAVICRKKPTPRRAIIRVMQSWGIHGEPGASVIDTQNSAQVVNLMVDKLLTVRLKPAEWR